MQMHGLPRGLTHPPRPLLTPEERRAQGTDQDTMANAPGTVILVAVFLLAFVTYYFLNWKILSFLWQFG